MTITQCGQVLGTIIASFTGIPSARVILKNEKFDAPKDGAPYVLIEYDGSAGFVGINSKRDPVAKTETMSTTTHERFAVEFCGFGQEATDRKNEIPMALRSQIAIRSAEDNNCSIFVAGPTLDLSAIEGSSALRRYRIPVIISNIERKTVAAEMIDKFPAPTINAEAK